MTSIWPKYFTNLDFPEIAGVPFPFQKATIGGFGYHKIQGLGSRWVFPLFYGEIIGVDRPSHHDVTHDLPKKSRAAQLLTTLLMELPTPMIRPIDWPSVFLGSNLVDFVVGWVFSRWYLDVPLEDTPRKFNIAPEKLPSQ